MSKNNLLIQEMESLIGNRMIPVRLFRVWPDGTDPDFSGAVVEAWVRGGDWVGCRCNGMGVAYAGNCEHIRAVRSRVLAHEVSRDHLKFGEYGDNARYDWMRALENKRKADDPDYMTESELFAALANAPMEGES